MPPAVPRNPNSQTLRDQLEEMDVYRHDVAQKSAKVAALQRRVEDLEQELETRIAEAVFNRCSWWMEGGGVGDEGWRTYLQERCED